MSRHPKTPQVVNSLTPLPSFPRILSQTWASRRLVGTGRPVVIGKNHTPKRDPGPSYGGVGPESSGGVWGLKSLGFEGPRVVWSVWARSKPNIDLTLEECFPLPTSENLRVGIVDTRVYRKPNIDFIQNGLQEVTMGSMFQGKVVKLEASQSPTSV